MRHYQRGIATTIILILFLISGVAITTGYFIFYQNQQRLKSINSFESCSKYYPVMESYPEQCNTPDGKNFVRELSEEEKQKLVPPSPEPSLSDETANEAEPLSSGNWKTYRNKDLNIEFKYPENYKILKEGVNFAEVSIDQLGEGLVTVADNSSDQFIDYNSLSSCKEVKNPGGNCLEEGKKWGQSGDIVDDYINGVKMKSYYLLYNGPGITLHVFQTAKSPLLSLSYPLFAEKYRNVQEEIVRTLKFLK